MYATICTKKESAWYLTVYSTMWEEGSGHFRMFWRNDGIPHALPLTEIPTTMTAYGMRAGKETMIWSN